MGDWLLLGDASASEQYENYNHAERAGYQKTFGIRRRVGPMKLLIQKFTIVLGHGRVPDRHPTIP